MAEFKIGDRVEVIKGDNSDNERFIKGYQFVIDDTKYKGYEDDAPYVWEKDNEFGISRKNIKLVEGAKMKDTITLKELIEQDACKDGVLWFMDNFERFESAYPVKRDNYSFLWVLDIDYIVDEAVKQGKPEYITWLKEHGYAVNDKQTKLDDLKKRMDELQAEFEELSK